MHAISVKLNMLSVMHAEQQPIKKTRLDQKKLYLNLTVIGGKSMPNYAKRVSKITDDIAAKKQLKNHKVKLTELIKEENEKLIAFYFLKR